jgi:hypothetical protein
MPKYEGWVEAHHGELPVAGSDQYVVDAEHEAAAREEVLRRWEIDLKKLNVTTSFDPGAKHYFEVHVKQI